MRRKPVAFCSTSPGNSNAVGSRKAIVLQAGEGVDISVQSIRFLYKVRSSDTGGQYAFTEGVVPPGRGAPLHVHHLEDEGLYVVEPPANDQPPGAA